MSTLGKVLLVINLLAAMGLAYVATQDWAKRQDVTSVALRYHLALQGLPVTGPNYESDAERIPLSIQLSGGVTTEEVRKSLLTNHFQGADGGPTYGGEIQASQLAEVKRVQTKVKTQLNAANQSEKLALLAGQLTRDQNNRQVFVPGILTRMATTYEERTALRQLASPQNPQELQANAERAEKIFDDRFAVILSEPNPTLAAEEAEKVRSATEALKKASEAARTAFAAYLQNPQDLELIKAATEATQAQAAAQTTLRNLYAEIGSGATRDPIDRKQRIAHTLAHLDPSQPWQKRVALVVGLRTYQDTIAQQIDRLRSMALSAENQTVFDQAAFTEEYELLRGLSDERTLLLQQQLGVRADLQNQRNKDIESVRQRFAQLGRRQADLTAIKSQVAQALERQGEIESQLFALQQQVGDTQRKIFGMEDQLKAAEDKAAAASGQ